MSSERADELSNSDFGETRKIRELEREKSRTEIFLIWGGAKTILNVTIGSVPRKALFSVLTLLPLNMNPLGLFHIFSRFLLF